MEIAEMWRFVRIVWKEPSGLLFYFGCAVFATAPAWLAAIFIWTHQPPLPTADQLYGCTVQQQAPNGECK
jgi:hypothetical protein